MDFRPPRKAPAELILEKSDAQLCDVDVRKTRQRDRRVHTSVASLTSIVGTVDMAAMMSVTSACSARPTSGVAARRSGFSGASRLSTPCRFRQPRRRRRLVVQMAASGEKKSRDLSMLGCSGSGETLLVAGFHGEGLSVRVRCHPPTVPPGMVLPGANPTRRAPASPARPRHSSLKPPPFLPSIGEGDDQAALPPGANLLVTKNTPGEGPRAPSGSLISVLREHERLALLRREHRPTVKSVKAPRIGSRMASRLSSPGCARREVRRRQDIVA